MITGPVIGVDVGGTKMMAGLVDRDGEVAHSHTVPTPVSSEEEFLAGVERSIAELVEEQPVRAIGLGIPSRIDQRSGTAIASTNVPLTDVGLRDRIAGRFGVPVGIDNDANVAAIAEWQLGAGRGARDLIMLTLGTGVGGGVIAGGSPFRGATGAGVEFGHIVVAHDGPPCQGTCTGRGHLEALASGGAANRIAREVLGPDADARELLARARAGDRAAAAAVELMGRHLGSGIASLINIFEPEIVIVGGGFAAAGLDLLGPPARQVVARDALSPARDTVRVALPELGVEAGMIGAALVGFEAADGSL